MRPFRSIWNSLLEFVRPTRTASTGQPAASLLVDPPDSDAATAPPPTAEGAVFLHTGGNACVHAVWRSAAGEREETAFTAPGQAHSTNADLALSAFAWLYERACSQTGRPVPVWVGHGATRRGLIELAASFPAVSFLGEASRIAPVSCPTTEDAASAVPAPVTPAEPQVVATDASVGKRAGAGIACVAECGEYGQGFAPTGDVTLAELLAIRLALTSFAGPLTVLTDSRAALSRIQHPSTATAKQRATLTKIQRLRKGRVVTFHWVKGHNGHALNEAADRLAVAARRAHEFNQAAHIKSRIAAGIVADLAA